MRPGLHGSIRHLAMHQHPRSGMSSTHSPAISVRMRASLSPALSPACSSLCTRSGAAGAGGRASPQTCAAGSTPQHGDSSCVVAGGHLLLQQALGYWSPATHPRRWRPGLAVICATRAESCTPFSRRAAYLRHTNPGTLCCETHSADPRDAIAQPQCRDDQVGRMHKTKGCHAL